MKIHLLYLNIGYLCFGFLKKLQQELPKNMLLSFSNKFFFHKFIYKSILSMILLKMIYDIECSTFRKKTFCGETFPLSIVNNSL